MDQSERGWGAILIVRERWLGELVHTLQQIFHLIAYGIIDRMQKLDSLLRHKDRDSSELMFSNDHPRIAFVNRCDE